MLSSLAPLVLFSTLFITGGSAQKTNANCLSSFGWANNSLEQSPCLVAAYLQGACQNNGVFTMPALGPNQHYVGPTLQNANPCQCSTVLYSVVSACGACQGRSYDTWSGWSANCSNIYPVVFPDNIPSGTAVPGWAYLDVRVGDAFNPAAAQRDLSAPESTGTTIPTGTLPGTTTPTPTSTPSVTPTSTSSSASASPSVAVSSKSSSHAGAIAGGVVGGLAFLSILAALPFWYFRRRHSPPPRPRPTPATYGAFDASESSVRAMSQQRILSPAPTFPTTTSSQHRLYDSPDTIPMPSSPGGTTDMYTTYSAYQGSVADHQTSPDTSHQQEHPEAPEM